MQLAIKRLKITRQEYDFHLVLKYGGKQKTDVTSILVSYKNREKNPVKI